MSINCEDKTTLPATRLSITVLPFIINIAICFLLFSLVHSFSLLHNIHYNNLAYAITGKHYTITIPKGSANPEVDITKLGPKEWYLPRELLIGANDTVTWINQDTEAHTVTSGAGAGMESLVNVNKKGIQQAILIVVYLSQDNLGHILLLVLGYTIISVLFIHGWKE